MTLHDDTLAQLRWLRGRRLLLSLPPRQQLCLLLLPLVLIVLSSCSQLRVTDPPRTATEEFLENQATTLAVEQLATTALRDRKVFIDTIFLTASTQPSDEQQYLVGELRAKLLLNGVRIVDSRSKSDITMEVRSQAISVDRIEFLIGIPPSAIPGFATGATVTTPEIALIKSTKQHGFASVAYVAYWSDSGEVVASSGPFVGRTIRDDWWFFGFGPQTVGNIPPAEPPPAETPASAPAKKEPPPPPPPPEKKDSGPPVQSFKGKGPAAG